VRGTGDGGNLWRLEVVLWRCDSSKRAAERLIATVLNTTVEFDGDVPQMRDVESTSSYDIQPPGGGVGIAFWVRADEVGSAADIGWAVVRDAAAELFVEAPQLWDLRVIPREAILADESPRTNLTK
jgi:hypothetical protein